MFLWPTIPSYVLLTQTHISQTTRLFFFFFSDILPDFGIVPNLSAWLRNILLDILKGQFRWALQQTQNISHWWFNEEKLQWQYIFVAIKFHFLFRLESLSSALPSHPPPVGLTCLGVRGKDYLTCWVRGTTFLPCVWMVRSSLWVVTAMTVDTWMLWSTTLLRRTPGGTVLHKTWRSRRVTAVFDTFFWKSGLDLDVINFLSPLQAGPPSGHCCLLPRCSCTGWADLHLWRLWPPSALPSLHVALPSFPWLFH